MKKIFLFFISFLMLYSFGYAQQGVERHYEPYHHFWTGLDAEHKLSEKVRIGIDVPYRRQSLEKGSFKIYEHLHWYGFRLWATIRLSNELDLNLSPIAYFYEVPPTNEQEGLQDWQDELRFSFRFRYSPEGAILSHRYGLERRFRRDNEDNHWKEYRIRYMLHLNKKIYKEYSLIADNEIFINMGKDIGYNIFDMNRIIVGIRKEFHPALEITAGYQNILDLLSSGEEFTVVHAFTLTFSFNSTLND